MLQIATESVCDLVVARRSKHAMCKEILSFPPSLMRGKIRGFLRETLHAE